mmetsp:Transcript_2971/g.7230  ORF Transcript_2971/g.7230 Transcript_2971/m.7230 type:complete len:390 (+) Transcript_2971:113-1282(+)
MRDVRANSGKHAVPAPRKMYGGRRTSVYVPGKGWKTPKRQAGQTPRPVPRIELKETTLRETAPTLVEEKATGYVVSFDVGSFDIPHPKKAEKGGEDAHFVFNRKDTQSNTYALAIGVADGVSSWANDGVDPSLYSKQLCEKAFAAAAMESDPKGIMTYAHANADALGTSTMTVVTLDAAPRPPASEAPPASSAAPGATLRACNVGDSGFRVYRDGRLIHESRVMEHYFNCPYQLGNKRKVPTSDRPHMAECYDVRLSPGDVVVVATDGVFDNLFDKDIGAICRDLPRDADDIARKIVRSAAKNAKDANYVSPFAQEANIREKVSSGVTTGAGPQPDAGQEGPLAGVAQRFQTGTILDVFNQFFEDMGIATGPHKGGKLDDITCCVAVVN